MVVVETNFIPPKAVAWTVFPFVFVRPGHVTGYLLRHEQVHWNHQKAWCLYGLGVGLLLWFLLYLVVLPAWWNPLRAYTERRAFRAQGYSDPYITDMLTRPPYYLKWGLKW